MVLIQKVLKFFSVEQTNGHQLQQKVATGPYTGCYLKHAHCVCDNHLHQSWNISHI